MMKRMTMILIVIAVMVGSLGSVATAAPGTDLRIIAIVVNGLKVRFPDTEPYINTDGRTMVPVRFVSEKLGAVVKWDNDTRVAIVIYEDKTIRMPIDSKVVTVNGEEVELDTAAEMHEGRTMVPLRFVSEVLGSKVEWDNGARTALITDAEYQAKVDAGIVKLNSWGRELSKNNDPNWIRLTDLEKEGFYEVERTTTNRAFFEEHEKRGMKKFIDEWSDHIRNYYAAQLNVDYRTISEKSFADTLIKNMKQMSSIEEHHLRNHISAYVEWVKENKVITKGYADPEPYTVNGTLSGGVSLDVYFKFQIISATDTSQTFLDNWNTSPFTRTYNLEKGKWYGGFSMVTLDTNFMSFKESGYAVRIIENMFNYFTPKYQILGE